jgi:hypothetical protein
VITRTTGSGTSTDLGWQRSRKSDWGLDSSPGCTKPSFDVARHRVCSDTLTDTRLEPDLEDLLWSTVNLFHRAADRIERELDGNEQAQRRSHKEQDGSEVRSVELERLLAEGTTLIERRNAFEAMRDQAAELFETHTGSAWRPRAGSMVNHRTLTASLIDSRDFLAAKGREHGERCIQRGIRNDVAKLVQIGAQPALLAELARQHPIRCIQRHAQEHPCRDQQEDDPALGQERDHKTHHHRTGGRGGRDLVRRDACGGGLGYGWTKHGLKPRLKLIQRHG